MGQVHRSPQANRDLAEIWAYIARKNAVAADGLMDKFQKKLELLSRFPEMGTSCEELSPGLRCFPAGKHVLFYRRSVDGIEVARVIHGARDIPRLFHTKGS